MIEVPNFVHPYELDISDIDPIKQFSGQYSFLSNFEPAEIVYQDFKWKSVEHAYQAVKQVPVPAYELNRLTPGQAKRAGRQLYVRRDWDRVKFGIMHDLTWIKFISHDQLAAKLIATDNRYLSEGNWHKDEYWGFYFATNRGLNNLGLILMSHRYNLKLLYGI